MSANRDVYIGIDPGIATVGFAFLKGDRDHPQLLDFGVVTTEAGLSLETRLQMIWEDFGQLLEQYQPSLGAIEEVYYGANVTSASQVYQARGVLMLLLHQHGVQMQELHPSSLKLGITGDGSADKRQVQEMLQRIFSLEQLPHPDDAADALGMAYMALLHSETS